MGVVLAGTMTSLRRKVSKPQKASQAHAVLLDPWAAARLDLSGKKAKVLIGFSQSEENMMESLEVILTWQS